MLKRILDSSEVSLAGLGFDLAASVAVAAAVGWWIDRRFDTEPWGLMICASIGIVGGLLNFVRASQRVMRRQAERRDSERSDGEGEDGRGARLD